MHGVGTDTTRRPRAPRPREAQRGPAGVERTAPRRGHLRTDRGGLAGEAELRHEARAALLGVEAAASGLTGHRLLTAEQIDELSTGLVAEVRRLLALLDERSAGASCFDLHDAIAPVLTCARAEGLEVRSTVPRGIGVVGNVDSTAQVLLALLTNAQRHALGSPVDVRVSTVDGVAVYVEDRGPGVPESLQERVFERHMQAVGSDGSGLGLFIARRLMQEQGGTIAVEPRAGGGSSFVLRLQGWPAEPRDGESALASVLAGVPS
jgi:signal transduction histidine kinase